MQHAVPADIVVAVPWADAIARAIELPDSVVSGVAAGTYAVFGQSVVAFEKVLYATIPRFMNFIDEYSAANQHPFASRLPLMKFSYVLFALAFYVVALLALYPIGKMLGKQKYRPLGLFHNLFLFLLSAYMSFGIFVTAVAAGYSLWNNPVGSGPHDWRMAKILWLFYISKLPEFMDTFLMMLKQNYRQVSFLHLYHHTSVFVFWFFVTNLAPGGEAYWSAMVNSGVHVVMYGYYFGTMLFVTGPVRNFLNAFKFFITKGQMTQFVLNCVQTIYDLQFANPLVYRADLIQALFWYMISLLALFGNFLIRNNKGTRNPAGSPTSPLVAAKEFKKKK